MKKMFFNMIMASAALVLAAGCSEVNPEYTAPETVEPEEIDRTAFAKGADISWVTKMESEGIKFYNAAGEETECTALMKQIGMNSIRLRVWVDPEEGWNGKGDVVAKALRAQKLGMRIMIDFHYSDTWADPANQTTPAAWKSYDIEHLKSAVTAHTTDVLQALKTAGVDVEWVQVGNETRDGMLWDLGRATTNPLNYTALNNAGYDAAKAVYPEAKVVVHLDNGNEFWYYERIFGILKKNGGKFDIIGMSLYPSSDWKSATESCIANITKCNQTYGCPVMICEVGMPWDDPENAKAMLSRLITGAKATGCCDGVFYWEPEAPAGYNGGYSLGAFADGKPTAALDAFAE
jgi:arabinogalactan endo-1,4-beta-galactosidase